MRQKCFPSFWGRNILGDNVVTKKEIEFLKERNCKLKLIVGDLTEKSVSSSNGYEDASRSIAAADELGVPQGKKIALFAKILPEWSINHNWMISYARMLFDNGYVPGFIGNTDSYINFNFDRQCSHYIQATKQEDYYNAIFSATEPKVDNMPVEWTPYCPSALNQNDIHMWNTGEFCFNNIKIEEEYARDTTVLDCMWEGDN